MAGPSRAPTPAPRDPGAAMLYRPDLDGIRALAVAAVMLYHLFPVLGGYDYLGGFLGVDVFFVLSGFLITTLLVRELDRRRTIGLRTFYARRALRLLPPLAVAVAFGAVVQATLGRPITPMPYWRSTLYAILYVGNWFHAHTSLGLLGHTWSLSIEEQYYLLWPLTLLVLTRFVRTRRGLAGLLVIGAAGVALLRFAAFATGHVSDAAVWTVTRTDGIMLGSALGLVAGDPPVWLRSLLRQALVPVVAAAVIIGISIFVQWNSPNIYRGELFLTNVCTAALLGHLCFRPRSGASRVLSFPPLPTVGRISYALYLFHIPMYYLVVGHPYRWLGWRPAAVAVGGTLVAAILSFVLLERPLMRWRRRLGSVAAAAVVSGQDGQGRGRPRSLASAATSDA